MPYGFKAYFVRQGASRIYDNDVGKFLDDHLYAGKILDDLYAERNPGANNANNKIDPKKFAGVVSANDKIIYVLPKYIDLGGESQWYKEYREGEEESEKLLGKATQLLAAINKYTSDRFARVGTWKENEEDNHGAEERDAEPDPGKSLVGLILSMFTDYEENGLFSAEKGFIEPDGPGDISWERTIDNVIPFVQDNKPYYFELLTRRTVEDEENWFRKLHKSVLLDAYGTLCHYGLDTSLGVRRPELEGERLSYFGESDYVHRRIGQELCVTFRTRQQAVLKNIDAYISRKSEMSSNGIDIICYGTANADDLWEKACAAVFGNMLYEPLTACLEKLSCKEPPSDFLSEGMKSLTGEAGAGSACLSEVIDFPLWTPMGKTSEKKRKSFWIGKDIPDIVLLGKDRHGEKYLYILDAKNYAPDNIKQYKFEPKPYQLIDEHLFKDKLVMANVPGIEDIRKQFVYYLDFKDFCEKCGIGNIGNCFLMPSDSEDDEAELIWTVSIGALQGAIGACDISVYALPAAKIYERYIYGETVVLPDYLGSAARGAKSDNRSMAPDNAAHKGE